MKIFWIVLLGISMLGCKTTIDQSSNNTKTDLENEKSTLESTGFQFSDFKVMKGQLGPIKVGMTIQEAEKQFNGLTKVEDYADNFGFGGGGPAYLYYLGDEILFGLIPSLGTDTLLVIIAVHKKLQTTNGLNPNSTVNELVEKYPDLMVYLDLMNEWEVFEDTVNNWYFVFMTDEQTNIGEYPDRGNPSRPKRLTTKTDWITIR